MNAQVVDLGVHALPVRRGEVRRRRTVDLWVAGDEGEAVAARLCDQHAIERVAVQAASDLLRDARVALSRCVDPGRLTDLMTRAERVVRLAAPGLGEHPPAEELSDRELAVLRLLQSDLTQREIAARLFVSFNTVKTHTKSIFRKLNTSTRAEAVRRGRGLGLI